MILASAKQYAIYCCEELSHELKLNNSLPITQTLDINSNLPLTKGKFFFPSGHFVTKFTPDNSGENWESPAYHYFSHGFGKLVISAQFFFIPPFHGSSPSILFQDNV